MTAPLDRWPAKVRDMHNHHFDSTIWDEFNFRDDDIFIGTYAKSGTTWTQQIVSQLIFGGAEGINVPEISPWLDLRVPPREIKLPAVEAQTHRRFIKTHLPVDALRVHEKARYIYIGRDGRDVVWSMYNHHANANAGFYEALNGPGLVGDPIQPPPADVRQYFIDWLDRDGHPFWPFWENIHSWWQVRELDNMLLIHFNDLKADLPGNIRRIAAFLDIGIDPARFDDIVLHCTFDYMKENAANAAPLGGAFWEGGAKTFINKGTNERWRDVLTDADNARYEAMAVEKLGEACAHWLKTGER
ncbi:MAG: sulfotransferase domain-containing protein [Alphaproteobacteria bacterium]|nr:MAG: sulfotransferase domain-containing protein [Alphaproteobacteria bacterium]